MFRKGTPADPESLCPSTCREGEDVMRWRARVGVAQRELTGSRSGPLVDPALPFEGGLSSLP